MNRSALSLAFLALSVLSVKAMAAPIYSYEGLVVQSNGEFSYPTGSGWSNTPSVTITGGDRIVGFNQAQDHLSVHVQEHGGQVVARSVQSSVGDLTSLVVASPKGWTLCQGTVGKSPSCDSLSAQDCVLVRKSFDKFAKQLGGKAEAKACTDSLKNLSEAIDNGRKWVPPQAHKDLAMHAFKADWVSGSSDSSLTDWAKMSDMQNRCAEVEKMTAAVARGSRSGTNGTASSQ